jgi:uncharacterized protein (UPF0264 family)
MKTFQEFNEGKKPSDKAEATVIALISKLNAVKVKLIPQKTLEEANDLIDEVYMELADFGEDIGDAIKAL